MSNVWPFLANTKLRVEVLGVNRFWTVWNSWMPPNLSRLPNAIGVSPSRFALASIASNSANVVGGALTLALL